MWSYEKRLQYPISISTPNAKLASYIISQYGGPDGELSASMRYLSQRFSAANPRVAGLLTDIGTEELAHLEMIGAIVRQLTKGLNAQELEKAGFAPYYIDHTAIADLVEDLAAEQKARKTYDNILRVVKDPEVADPIRFLREREIVHFQRFGEALRMVQEELDSKNFYAFNPDFDCFKK